MTTFAEAPITYPDGQTTVVPVPEEIALRGFFPPVLGPDGRVILGDVLPAGWLNDMIRTAYRQLAQPLPVSVGTIPADFSVSSVTNGKMNWFAVSFGDIIIEAGMYRLTTAPGTTPAVPFGSTFRAGEVPHVFFYDVSDPNSATDKLAMWTSLTNGNASSQFGYLPLDRTNKTPGDFIYIAIGRKPTTSTPTFKKSWVKEPQKFIDGQTSFAEPTAEQISFGFAPPRLEGGKIFDGDTVPANVLNYIFHDLMSNANQIYWEVKTNSDPTYNSYRIIVGDIQIQSFRAVGTASEAPDFIDLPWPLGDSGTSATTFIFATPLNMAQPGVALASPYTSTRIGLKIRDTHTLNVAPAQVGIANILCIGTAPAGVLPAPKLVPALSGFASQAMTYADGQANKVKPSAAIMNEGFHPTRKDASGFIIPGDMVKANELNWLLDDLYKSAASNSVYPGTIAPNNAIFLAGGRFIEVGNLLIQFFALSAGSPWGSGSNLATIDYPRPFKAGTVPLLLAKGNNYSNNAAALFAAGTNSSFTVRAINILNGITTTPGLEAKQFLAIGIKP